MQVILAASGGGSRGTMTEDCRKALENASCIIGGSQTLGRTPGNLHQKPCASYRPGKSLGPSSPTERAAWCSIAATPDFIPAPAP